MAATTANPTAADTNSFVAVSRSQARRRAAIHATATTIPSSASRYACGARATAEWMKVPPGTWTADTSAEKAKRIAAYVRNGPKSTDRRLAHAADQHERQQDPARHERREDADGRHEATPTRLRSKRNGALAQEVAEGRRRRDRVPLLDRADIEDLARRGRGGQLAEDIELADPPRRHDREEQAEAGDGRPDRDRRSPRRRLTATPASGRRGRREPGSPPTSRPSFRDSVARPTSSPPIANDRA